MDVSSSFNPNSIEQHRPQIFHSDPSCSMLLLYLKL